MAVMALDPITVALIATPVAAVTGSIVQIANVLNSRRQAAIQAETQRRQMDIQADQNRGQREDSQQREFIAALERDNTRLRAVEEAYRQCLTRTLELQDKTLRLEAELDQLKGKTA